MFVVLLYPLLLADDRLRSYFTRLGGAPDGAKLKMNKNKKKHTKKHTKKPTKKLTDNMAHKTNKTDLKIEKLLSHKSYKPYRLLTHGTIHKAFKEKKKKLLLEKKWISARSSHRGPGRKGNRTSLPDPEEGPAAIYCLPRCKFFITCYWY